jgi:hypothetical protein
VSFVRMEIEKKVGEPRIRQQTLGPFHVADTVFYRKSAILKNFSRKFAIFPIKKTKSKRKTRDHSMYMIYVYNS